MKKRKIILIRINRLFHKLEHEMFGKPLPFDESEVAEVPPVAGEKIEKKADAMEKCAYFNLIFSFLTFYFSR